MGNEILKKIKDNLFGVEFLREAIDFFDSRPKFENEGKSPILLLEEFLKISDYGECQRCTYIGKLAFKEGSAQICSTECADEHSCESNKVWGNGFSGEGYYCDECGKYLS